MDQFIGWLLIVNQIENIIVGFFMLSKLRYLFRKKNIYEFGIFRLNNYESLINFKQNYLGFRTRMNLIKDAERRYMNYQDLIF